MRRGLFRAVLVGAALLAVTARPVQAQSAIAGQAKDTSGAVLPGVTVTASSPALIEGSKSATTNEQGQYNIVDLRPGTYTVLFELTGFRTVRREGVEVPANVVVPINGELAVGSLEETITVTGASPVVDTHSAQRTSVLSKEMLDGLPTSRSVSSLGAIVPGVRLSKPDLGGTQAMQQIYGRAHGMGDNENSINVDGMDVRPNADTASYQQYFNPGMTQEMTYMTAGVTADGELGGLRVNVIPRDGGNQWSGEMFGQGSNKSMQSNNLTAALKSRGLPSPSEISSMWDLNPVAGGPMRRDRMWIVASARTNSVNTHPAGSFYKNGQPGIEDQYVNYLSARLTTQVTPKNKFTVYYDRAYKFKGHDMTDTILAGGGTAGGIEVETASGRREPKCYCYGQAKLTSTLTSKVLLEAGISVPGYIRNGGSQPGVSKPAFTPEWYAGALRFDFTRGTQTTYGQADSLSVENGIVPTAVISYVTGAHKLQTGFSWKFGPRRSYTTRNADLTQRYNNGVPDSVVVYTTPDVIATYLNADLGIYVQDAWTYKRVTLTPGIRWNYLNASQEAACKPAGRFSIAQCTDRINNLPNYKDWTPRLSGAYDLFGNGKTAVKGSIGKYMKVITTSIAQRYSPFASSNETRTWKDLNADDIAQGDLNCDITKAWGTPGCEIGPPISTSFGVRPDRSADPNLRRPYTVQSSLSVQHELLPGLSMVAAWYHLSYRKIEVVKNVGLSLSDYPSFQVANPLNNGEILTVFNLNRAKLGTSTLVDSNSAINQQTYNGLELSFNGRLPHGIALFGGWTAERTVIVSCDTTDANLQRFCDQTGSTHQDLGKNASIPFRHEFKANATYAMPYGMQVGVAFISYAGDPIQSTFGGATIYGTNWVIPSSVFPNAQRTQTVNMPLESPGIDYLPRWGELDLSLRKIFRLTGRQSLEADVEVFNVPNASTVLSQQANLGVTLGNPASTLQGRFFKLGGRYRF